MLMPRFASMIRRSSVLIPDWQRIDCDAPPRAETPPPRIFALPLEVKRAAEGNDVQLVRAWVDEENGSTDATFDADPRLTGRTMLMMASAHGCERVVTFLIDRGATLDLQDGKGDTALMLASRARLKGYDSHDKQDRIVLYLLKEGARTDLMNHQGVTAHTTMNSTFVPGLPGSFLDAGNVIRPKSAPHRLRLVEVAPGGAFAPPGSPISPWAQSSGSRNWNANF